MLYQLPPVGNPVRTFQDAPGAASLQDLFSPYIPRYLESGTAALAAAVNVAVQLKRAGSPEVILPAYGCPDLVSAVVHAGAKPVLVDLEPERPWLNLDQLSARINKQTVAIIAVSLFGIPERMQALRPIADQARIVLIEDSAQAFPGKGHTGSFWTGDLVIVSFGRGKPVSLLGGGAVLYRDSAMGSLLPEGKEPGWSRYIIRILFPVQAAIYNLLLSPYVYWVPQGLPFLKLGATEYKPLHAIGCMDHARLRLLAGNIDRYRNIEMITQSAVRNIVREIDNKYINIKDLPSLCGIPADQRLLRYPLLINPESRDDLYKRLRHRGLGVSKMYPAILPEISGLEDLLGGQSGFPAAEDFARRILTLPTHSIVRKRDISMIRQVLEIEMTSAHA